MLATVAQSVSAAATFLGVVTALGIALWNGRRQVKDRELADRRAAALKLGEWIAHAQELAWTFQYVRAGKDAYRTPEEAAAMAKEHSDRLQSAAMHLSLITGPDHRSLHAAINRAGIAYASLLWLIDYAGAKDTDDESTEWKAATNGLYDLIAKECGYDVSPWAVESSL